MSLSVALLRGLGGGGEERVDGGWRGLGGCPRPVHLQPDLHTPGGHGGHPRQGRPAGHDLQQNSAASLRHHAALSA